jgi:hypothetical protein
VIRCILGRHDWLRVESGILVCRRCYKRGRPDDVHRWLTDLKPGWQTTRPRMDERGTGDAWELLLWAGLVGVFGGGLLFVWMLAGTR